MFKKLTEELNLFIESDEAQEAALEGADEKVVELVQDVTDEYGDLTIPEFIDALIKEEEKEETEEDLEESLNESYSVSDKRSYYLKSLIKTNFKNIKVKVHGSKQNENGYVTIAGPGDLELEGSLYAKFEQKSEQTNSWIIQWGSLDILPSYRSELLWKACKQAFPDYAEQASNRYSWDYVTFFTNPTLSRRTEQGNTEAIEELADQFNNILDKIDSIVGEQYASVDKELEELEKARAQARANKQAATTTVKRALSKSSVIKQIKALENPTQEQLAKILAAIQ